MDRDGSPGSQRLSLGPGLCGHRLGLVTRAWTPTDPRCSRGRPRPAEPLFPVGSRCLSAPGAFPLQARAEDSELRRAVAAGTVVAFCVARRVTGAGAALWRPVN